jgi:alpha-L-fucosidase
LKRLIIKNPDIQEKEEVMTADKYRPSWESLDRHPLPEWFDRAKFGIFIHWGVYSVPAYHEWYLVYMCPRAIYNGKNIGGPPYRATCDGVTEDLCKKNVIEDAYNYQRQKYGPDFAYDDFIPMFKAERYNPAEWAEIFKKAGARYVVLTAKHGDEFALWPSAHTDRNAGSMGPRRDLAGELSRAVQNEGMKMGFYHNTTYSFWDQRYPDAEWVDYMNNSIKELVDRYHPSILWGDVSVNPVSRAEGYKGKILNAEHWKSREVLSYFYNHSVEPDQVVANDRWDIGADGKMHGDYDTPERRIIEKISERKWETCDSLDPQSWGYNARLKEEEYMTVKQAVHNMVDIVSKNGNFLLNIGPKADGTIPEVMKERLLGIGRWLEINGEAIYGTRYWNTFGEENVRFTWKPDKALYAIALNWPGEKLVIRSLKGTKPTSVKMLGVDKELTWSQDKEALIINTPEKGGCENAYTFKIEFKN